MKKSKPRVAFFDFTDCEGCQLQFANMGEGLLKLAELVEIVNFREIMSEAGPDYEVAFVEGSVTTDSDIKRLQEIRKKAKVLIALGSCASIAGVNGMKNRIPIELSKSRVYGDMAHTINTIPALPLHKVVKVDYFIHGCPVYIPEVLQVIKCVLMQKPYAAPNYPVCAECKMNENVCRYEKDQECLGPVTRAGCNSWCINNGNKCYGCRGLVDNPASDAQKDILLNYGLSLDEVLRRFTLYNDSLGEKYDKEFK